MRRGGFSPTKEVSSERDYARKASGDHKRTHSTRPRVGSQYSRCFAFFITVSVSALLLFTVFAALVATYEKRKVLVFGEGDVVYAFVHRSYKRSGGRGEGEMTEGERTEQVEMEADGYKFYKRLNSKEGAMVSRLRYMHMGMLEILPNGSLAAFFQASESKHEGVFDQSIFWSMSEDLGSTWKDPVPLIRSNRKLPMWSPVAHRHDGRLFVFYSRSSKYCEYFDRSKGVMRHSPGGDVFYVASGDNGESWTFPQRLLAYEEKEREDGSRSPTSKPVALGEGQGSGSGNDKPQVVGESKPFGVPKAIANKIAVLSDGAWLLPYWREPGKTCPLNRAQVQPSQWVKGSAGVLYSEDQGLSWQIASQDIVHKSTWVIENSIAELGNTGVVLQTFRTKTGQAYKDYSYDSGLTWTQPQRTYLPNPNSKMCILGLPNGDVLAAYNHSPTRRTPLSLAVSKDGGILWSLVGHLETDPSLEFSYPTMQIAGDALVVIYSVMSRQSGALESLGIKTAKLSLSKLLG